jgi:hypothetical protein
MILVDRYEQTLSWRPPTRGITSDEPATSAKPAPPVAKASVTKRLEELDALRAHGLITNDEYQRKRADILRDL